MPQGSPQLRILVLDDNYREPARSGGDRAVSDLSRTLGDLGHVVVHSIGPPHPPTGQDRPGWDLIIVSRPELGARLRRWANDSSRLPPIYLGHDLHHRRLASAAPGAARALLSLERVCWQSYRYCLYPSADEVSVVTDAGGAGLWFPYFRVDDDDNGGPLNPQPTSSTAAQTGIESPLIQLTFVGGSSHHPNVSGLLWFAAEVAPSLATTLGEQRIGLRVVGQWDTDSAGQLRNAWPEPTGANSAPELAFTGPVSADDLHHLLRTSTAVVAPLVEGAGVKSKVIDALASGSPLITTGVGLQGIPGSERVCYLADTPHQWLHALRQVIADPAEAATRVSAAAALVERRYGATAYTAAVAELISSLEP